MSEQTPQQPAPAKPRNRRPLIIIGAVALLAIAGWALYYLTVARFRVGTDDAYVDGNLVRLTPQVAGTVTAIRHRRDAVRAPRPGAGAARSARYAGGARPGQGQSRRDGA